MDLNRVILEYGKAQLHIILLQEQLQSVNAQTAKLEKQLKDKTQTDPEPQQVRRRGVKQVEEQPNTEAK